MLLVAHELGKSLHEIEQMTSSEFHLHLSFMCMRAEREREEIEKAKSGGRGGNWKPVVSFKR